MVSFLNLGVVGTIISGYSSCIPICVLAANVVAPCSQVLITNREYRHFREWTISSSHFLFRGNQLVSTVMTRQEELGVGLKLNFYWKKL